jgi:hypothetical protein
LLRQISWNPYQSLTGKGREIPPWKKVIVENQTTNSIISITPNIQDLVRGEELMAAWKECVVGEDDAELRECQWWMAAVAAQRNEFLETLEDVPDQRDRDVLVATFYIALKSQWMMLNIRSGYRISAGKLDSILYCRSGLLSALLDRVERALPPVQVHRLTEFLSRPLELEEDKEQFPLGLLEDTAVSQNASEQTGGEISAEQRTSAERAALDAVFGRVDAEEIVAKFHLLRNQVEELEDRSRQRERDQQRLQEVFGTADAESIIRQIQAAEERLGALEELQQMLGSIEESIHLVGQ